MTQNFDQSTEKDIKNYLLETTLDEIDWDKLVYASQNFLSLLTKIVNSKMLSKEHTKKLKKYLKWTNVQGAKEAFGNIVTDKGKLNEEAIKQLYDSFSFEKDIKHNEYLRNINPIIEKYIHIINNFFNRDILYFLVGTYGEINILSNIELEDLFKKASFSGSANQFLKDSNSFGNLDNLRNQISPILENKEAKIKLEKSLKELRERIRIRQKYYQLLLMRAQWTYTSSREHKNKYLFFYYKNIENNRKTFSNKKIPNRGWFAEGYSRWIFDKEAKDNPPILNLKADPTTKYTQEQENILKLLDNRYITMDSIAGVAGGDILLSFFEDVLPENFSLQAQVKGLTSSFNVVNWKVYIDFAKAILLANNQKKNLFEDLIESSFNGEVLFQEVHNRIYRELYPKKNK